MCGISRRLVACASWHVPAAITTFADFDRFANNAAIWQTSLALYGRTFRSLCINAAWSGCSRGCIRWTTIEVVMILRLC